MQFNKFIKFEKQGFLNLINLSNLKTGIFKFNKFIKFETQGFIDFGKQGFLNLINLIIYGKIL